MKILTNDGKPAKVRVTSSTQAIVSDGDGHSMVLETPPANKRQAPLTRPTRVEELVERIRALNISGRSAIGHPGSELVKYRDDIGGARKKLHPQKVDRMISLYGERYGRKLDTIEHGDRVRQVTASRPKRVQPYMGVRFGTSTWKGCRTVMDRVPASTKEERLDGRFWSALIHPENPERLRENEPFVVLKSDGSDMPVADGEVLALRDFCIHPGVPIKDIKSCGGRDQHSATVIEVTNANL